MRRLALAALLSCLALPVGAIDLCGSGQRVTCVVDGDTFWFDGEKFRVMGYDTPEPVTGLCGGAGERRLARVASARLVELFNTSRMSIERHGADRYGRTLVVLRADGRDVGDILVEEGLARYWPDGDEFWCRPAGARAGS